MVDVSSPELSPGQAVPLSLPSGEQITLMGKVGGSGSSFFAGLRALGIFAITDPTFAGGAVGDFVHNDTPSFAGAIAAAVANGGGVVFVPQPPVAFRVLAASPTSNAITLSPGVMMVGTAAQPGECPIRAGGAMHAVINVQNYTSTLAPTPNRIVGLTIDGNGLASWARLDTGTILGTQERVHCTGGIIDGQRNANRSVPLALSAVTPGGGAPGGVTVSQPDPNYAGFLSAGVKQLVARIVTPGNLNVATYQMSFDNGATFQSATQLVAAKSWINMTSAAVYGPWTGVQFVFPPQAYPGGGTYAFSATVAPDQNNGATINADNSYQDCTWYLNGTVYGTAAVIGNYTILPARQLVTVVGTLATTAGSQVVQGTGTSLLATLAREGDIFRFNNALFANLALLDDLTFVTPANATPAFSLAGLDYAVAVGSGYYEDDNTENLCSHMTGGKASQNACASFRFAGQQGPLMTKVRTEAYGMAAYVWGSLGSVAIGSPVITAPHVEAGATGSASIYSYSVVPVSVLEPTELWVPAGPGGGFKLYQGTQFPWNGGAESLVPTYTERYVVAGAIPIHTGAETLTVPGLEQTSGQTLIALNPDADLVMNATPLFPGAGALPNGVVIRLYNVSTFASITLQADAQAATGLVLRSRYQLIGPSGYIVLQSLQGKLIQVGYESNGGFACPSGNPGDWASKTFVIADAAAHNILDFNIVNAGISSGTVVWYDIVARSSGVTNLAAWTGYRVMWDVAGHQLDAASGLAWGNNAGAPPAGWAPNLGTDVPDQFGQILLTADGSVNPVHGKIFWRHLSPPI